MGQVVMIRFEDLEEKVQRYHPEADVELLRKAYVFSAREHKGQIRLSGEPYLSHPLKVAHILAEMKLDVACVSVGLLHDVVEDTLTSLDTIREYFGEDIAHLVDGVTKISQIQFSSRHEKQAENFRKLLLAMVDDIRFEVSWRIWPFSTWIRAPFRTFLLRWKKRERTAMSSARR
jgi:GTP pyrophosphokinase